MNVPKGIKIYGISIIVFGIYNLLGVGSYKQFSLMFDGVPQIGISLVYLFTIFYGAGFIYCGLKLLKLENWARKVIVYLSSISVISGFFLNKIAMTNFKEYLETGQSGLPVDITGAIYSYIVVLTALITIYELSVIYYFTRPGVVFAFRVQGTENREQ